MTPKILSTQDVYELFEATLERKSRYSNGDEYGAKPTGFYRKGIGHFSGNVSFLPGLVLESTTIDTEDDFLVTDYTPTDSIDINFQLSGHLYSAFNDVDARWNMTPGKHNLLFAPHSKSSHRVNKNDCLQIFHISLENDYFLRMLGTADEVTEEWISSIHRRKAFAGAPKEQPITPAMMRIISEITTCNWTGVMRKLYLESKVIELLVLQIEQFKYRRTHSHTAAVSGDIDKLKQLKEMLDRNFLDEYTLYDLVKTTSLNEFKLKTGFKQLYNVPVFAYIKQLRMQHAYQLLTDSNMKVEEVSDILGYNHAHHFSAAFKKHFGKTPSSVKA